MPQLVLSNYTLDNGLNALVSECERIHICSSQPATFADVATYTLGYKHWGAGAAFGAVSAGSPDGRKTTSNAITNGTVTADGTAAYWAAVDNTNSVLFATGQLSSSVSVVNGQQFTLSAFTIHEFGHAVQPYDNSETSALATSISPAPPSSWLTAVDTLISSLKTGGIWSNLDLFYCFAAPNEDACTYNWVNTGVGRLTANGSLTYTENTCVNSNGTTGYFSSSFAVNSGFAVNSNAHFGYFCLSEDTNDNISVFQTTGGGRHWLGIQASATGATIPNATGALNTSTSASFSSLWGSTIGHWVLQQNTTTQLQMFLDGNSLGTSSQTNSADTGNVQIFRTSGGSYTDRKTAFVHYGSKLTNTQQLDLSKALHTFLATLDVRPKVGTPGQSTGPTNIAPYKHIAVGNGNSLSVPVTSSPSLITGLVQCRAGAFPYALIRVNDPNYLNLHRIEVHAGDPAPFDGGTIDRAQFNLLGGQSIPWQSTCDISFSFFIETGSSNPANFLDLPDLHDNQGGVNSGPTHAIHTDGQFFVWIYEGGTYPQTSKYACAKGQWHHVRTAFRLDSNPNGFVRTWFNGTQIWNYSGAMGLSANAPFWWNIPIYRGNSSTGSFAVWLANLESDISGTLPYDGRPASPLPVPTLT